MPKKNSSEKIGWQEVSKKTQKENYIKYKKPIGPTETYHGLLFEHLQNDFPKFFTELKIPLTATHRPKELKSFIIENKEIIYNLFLPYIEDASAYMKYQYNLLSKGVEEWHLKEETNLQTNFLDNLEKIVTEVKKSKDINTLFARARNYSKMKDGWKISKKKSAQDFIKQKSNIASVLILMMQEISSLPDNLSDTHRLLLNIRHEGEENDINLLEKSSYGFSTSLEIINKDNLSPREAKKIKKMVDILKEEHAKVLDIFFSHEGEGQLVFNSYLDDSEGAVPLKWVHGRHKKSSSSHRKILHKVLQPRHDTEFPLEASDFDGLMIVIEKEEDREKVLHTLLTHGYLSEEKSPRLTMVSNSIKKDVDELIKGKESKKSVLTEIQKGVWKKIISILQVAEKKDAN